MLISEAFDLYRADEIRAAHLSLKTDESYIYAKKLAIDYYGDIDVIHIDYKTVQKYYEHLLTWQKPDTARGNIICLRAVFKMLKRRKYAVLDPEDIKVPRREKREIYYLHKDEVEEFIDIVGRPARGYPEANRLRNIAIIRLLFCTGIRVSELCRLNRNTIRQRQFVVVGKSKDPRPCFITAEVEEAIKNYLKVRTDKNPALFISNQNEKRITPGNVRRVFQRACAQSDFDEVHPHTLRHSFATYLLDQGVDLLYIGELMGHQSLETTKMYTHYNNPKLRQIYHAAMGQ